jgi:acetyl-CoA carboxylase biotin carboxylase subunit
MPSPGKIEVLNLPGGRGVRVDTHIFEGYSVPPFYDSLLAKLITHGKDRNEAIQIMKRALDEFIIEPIKTTIPFYRKLLEDPRFLRGEVSTDFLNEFLKERVAV